MNALAALPVFLILGLASTAPLNDKVLSVTSQFFPEALSIYKSNHDIVNLFCPLNSLNFDEHSGVESLEGMDIHLFFIEADIKDGGAYDYKGLYVLKNKVATKLLDNGKDFAASSDDSKNVFFAATDGIYVYNAKENKAEKYGTITDSLIGIAVSNASDYLYILSEDHVLYKVSGEGTNKEVVSEVKDATQIVLDYEDNLFFVDSKKHVYARSVDGVVKKIKGTPSNPSFSKLLRPPFALDEGVPYVGGKKVFTVYPNGTSEYENLVLKARPSAYSVEATILQYYAYEKQIYEYNLLSIMLGSVALDEVKTYFADKSEDIKNMGTKSRTSFRSSN